MLERGEAIAGLNRWGCVWWWSVSDFAAIGTPMMDRSVGVDGDSDVPTVDERMVIVAFGHEIFDVVVPAKSAVVAMVNLHERGCAAGPAPDARRAAS